MYCKLWVILTLLQTISKLSIEAKETDVPSLNHGRSACDVTEHTNVMFVCLDCIPNYGTIASTEPPCRQYHGHYFCDQKKK